MKIRKKTLNELEQVSKLVTKALEKANKVFYSEDNQVQKEIARLHNLRDAIFYLSRTESMLKIDLDHINNV